MSTQTPWLSVLVAAYNAENYLQICIDSMQLENNRDIQLIIVDDGSTDGTPIICEQAASKFSNIEVVHKPNGGTTSARNAGLPLVRSEWVWFVDADDVVSPDAFDLLKPVLNRTKSQLIHFNFEFFRNSDTPDWTLRPKSSHAVTTIDAAQFLHGTYDGTFRRFDCSFVYSKEALSLAARSLGRCIDNLFYTDIILYEDVLFCETLCRVISTVDFLDERIYGCRHVVTSMTNKKSDKSAASGLKAIRMINEFDSLPSDRSVKAMMEMGLLFHAYGLTENRSSSGALRSEIKKEIKNCCRSVRFSQLSRKLKIQYILLVTRTIDFAVWARDVLR